VVTSAVSLKEPRDNLSDKSRDIITMIACILGWVRVEPEVGVIGGVRVVEEELEVVVGC